jgi:hypothetical protein
MFGVVVSLGLEGARVAKLLHLRARFILYIGLPPTEH